MTKEIVNQSTKLNIGFVALLTFALAISVPFASVSILGIGLMLIIGIPLMFFASQDIYKRFMSGEVTTIVLFLFFSYGLFAYTWSPEISVDSIYQYLKIFIIVICLYCCEFNVREKKLIIVGSILSCLIVCYFMITQQGLVGYHRGRATVEVFGVLQDPNYMAYIFFFALAATIRGVLSSKNLIIKITCFFLTCAIFTCILFTGSRGALFSCLILLVAAIIFKNKLSWKSIALFAVAIFIAWLVFPKLITYVSPEIAERFTLEDLIASRGSKRFDIWNKTFEIFKEHPESVIFGFGSGSSNDIIGKATHNFYIQLLFEYGLVGFSLFMWLAFVWFKRLLKCDYMFMSVYIACLAMAFTLSVRTSHFFWIIIVLSIVCSINSQENKQEIVI